MDTAPKIISVKEQEFATKALNTKSHQGLWCNLVFWRFGGKKE
jgi:hypothetical protein